jgi:hypothetical protein
VGRLSNPPTVDIYFDPETGEMKVETQGQKGDCVDLTAALERLLGLDPNAKKSVKGEFYEGGDGKKRTESIRRG